MAVLQFDHRHADRDEADAFHDAHPHGDLRWAPIELWTAPKEAGDQRNDKQHEEYEEQELGDFGCANGDATKAEERCDERDHEKYCGIVQHGVPL
jgi:hypothetical protein